jgi:hypothetical protein
MADSYGWIMTNIMIDYQKRVRAHEVRTCPALRKKSKIVSVVIISRVGKVTGSSDEINLFLFRTRTSETISPGMFI